MNEHSHALIEAPTGSLLKRRLSDLNKSNDTANGKDGHLRLRQINSLKVYNRAYQGEFDQGEEQLEQSFSEPSTRLLIRHASMTELGQKMQSFKSNSEEIE